VTIPRNEASGGPNSLRVVTSELCSWCGEPVEADDGFRAFEPAGERHAVFCRLEHVVPWVIQGAHWSADEAVAGPGDARVSDVSESETCAHCAGAIGDRRVLLARHRGEHRIADAFCQVEHMFEWAKAGGRWQT